MNRLGINYDVGTAWVPGATSREVWEPGTVRREMEIIARDLGCNTIRISGQDPARLALATEYALDSGLEVWFSPALIDGEPAGTLAYLAECAAAAEALRRRRGKVVFVAGCELSLFMRGFIDGQDLFARLRTLTSLWRMAKSAVFRGDFNALLGGFLARAVEAVRARFGGPLTYASATWETVPWGAFDFVGVDLYRDARNARDFAATARAYRRHGKPVVITEFGCCPYQGAEDRGGVGWTIVDWEATPPRIREALVRDESVQVRYFEELFEIFEAEGIDGALWFTFSSPRTPHLSSAEHDLDLASYGVVKTMLPGSTGVAFPGLPWEPKAVFAAMAKRYRH